MTALAAPAAADVEFWFQNKSTIEVQGVLIVPRTGETKAVYLRAGQGQPITVEGDCWRDFKRSIVGGLIIQSCGGLEYEYRARMTNIANRNDVFCEAAMTFTETDGRVSIYFRLLNSQRSMVCVTSGMTETGNEEGAWLELRMN